MMPARLASGFGRYLDLAAVVLMLGLGALIGLRWLQTPGVRPDFYQKYFAPSVLLACGKGFWLPETIPPGPLQKFLHTRLARFDCRDLPVDLKPRPGMGAFGEQTRYLMWLVGEAWRLQGEVAWNRLHFLFGLFYGVTLGLAYGLFRLGMGRGTALGLCALLATSGLHLQHLPLLRDYSKAPFFLAVLLLAGLLVRGPPTPRRMVLLSVIGGLVVGAGLGFRFDLLVALPVIPFTLLFLTPVAGGNAWKLRSTALLGFVLGFLLLGGPVLSGVSRGGNQWHPILLGRLGPVHQLLQLNPAPLYRMGTLSNDTYVVLMVNSYAHRLRGQEQRVGLVSPGYDRFSREMVFWHWRSFPADWLIAAWASIQRVLEMPLAYRPQGPAGGGGGEEAVRPGSLTRWKNQVHETVPLLPLVLAGGTILALWRGARRYGVFALLVIAYFGAYPVLQFHWRHVFHLEVLFWWTAGFLGYQGFLWLRRGRPAWVEDLRRQGQSVLKQALVGGGGGCLLFLTVLILLRHYQTGRVWEQVRQLEPIPLQGAAWKQVPDPADPSGYRLLSPPAPVSFTGNPPPVTTDYLVLELGGAGCPLSVLTLQFRYQTGKPLKPLIETRLISFYGREGTRLRFYYPVYQVPWQNAGADRFFFEGVRFRARDRACVGPARFLKSVPPAPVLMQWEFWEDAASQRAYDELR